MLKLHLTKGKKLKTIQILGQIQPYHRLSLHVLLGRAEERTSCSHCAFPPSSHRAEVPMAPLRLSLATSQSERACIKPKTILFALGKVWTASLPVLRVNCFQKNSLVFFALWLAVAVHGLWSVWLWGFYNYKHLWQPRCIVAFSILKLIFFFSRWCEKNCFQFFSATFFPADSDLIRFINKTKQHVFCGKSFEMRWDCYILFKTSCQEIETWPKIGRPPGRSSCIAPKAVFFGEKVVYFCQKCNCFCSKYLFCFLKCTLSTNAAMKQPLSGLLYSGKTEAST